MSAHIDIHWLPRPSHPGYDVYAVRDDAEVYLRQRKRSLFSPKMLRELIERRARRPDWCEIRHPTSDGLQDVSDYQLNELADVNESE